MSLNVSSDTSFYICISEDLQKRNHLCRILNSYPFFLGKNILREIPESMKEWDEFQRSINYLEGDFFQLVKPFFGRDKNHETDGEYEAIGIAYRLERKNSLKYLILDERRARNFVKMHFPSLKLKLTRSFGFLKNACCNDGRIHSSVVIEILETAIQKIKANGKLGYGSEQRRPCGMTLQNYEDIIIPILDQIKSLDG